MPGEHVGEGAHTRGQGQIVELLRALPAVPDEVVEQFLMGLQLLLAFDQQVAALGEQCLGGGVQVRAEQVLAQAREAAEKLLSNPVIEDVVNVAVIDEEV